MLDFELFRYINGMAGRALVLDVLGIFFAVHLIALIILIVAIAAFIQKKISIFTLGVASAALGFLVSQIIGLVNFRPRPFVFLEEVKLLITKSPESKSFPSDHATLAFALAASVYLSGEKKLGIILFILAFFVALGRVFTGVHFPLDIAIGAAVGILSALAVNKVWKKFYAAKK